MFDLDADRWGTVNALLDRLLDLPAEEREPYLTRACGGDTVLLAEVERLWREVEAGEDPSLWAHGALGGALGDRLLTEADAEDLPAGTEVGAYRVVRELGRGGMGAVYHAERADGAFEQAVALKLVKRGLETRAVLRRFLHERRVLARLTHPNIARLLDGGVTDDGRPYFAMEYVEGEPVTDYADARRLPVAERLALFEQACEAVQHAHRSLVVHRDLKPSNVLVTEDADGRPHVKLLDFGIAKVLAGEGDDEDALTLTEAGARVLTPAYAAPEQLRGEAVTTATDVYALGVILYELLTGKRPRMRPGVPVPRPSAAVTAEAAGARSATAEQLRRRLRGDLDGICQKALREEAEERYASVEGLLDDLRRHWAGLPVAARPASAPYRVWKFVGRHRTGVMSVSIFLLLLIATSIFHSLRVRAERDRTEEVGEMLSGLFESLDPWAPQAWNVAMLLQEGEAQTEQMLRNQPELQAQMLIALGRVYRGLGIYGVADTLVMKALAIRQGVYGEEHPLVAESLYDLGIVLHDEGAYAESAAVHRRALSLARTLGETEHPRVAEGLSGLGDALTHLEAYEEAADVLRASVAMNERLHGREHPATAESLHDLALVFHDTGEYAASESLHRDALRIRQALLGSDHLLVSESLRGLGDVLIHRGSYDEAEACLRRVLAIRQRHLGPNHPEVGWAFYNLAFLMQESGRLLEAERLYRNALTHGGTVEATNPMVTESQFGLSEVLARLGRRAEAELLLRTLLEAYSATGDVKGAHRVRERLEALPAPRDGGVPPGSSP